jgi:TM2 domain-containing membrane protein YozV
MKDKSTAAVLAFFTGGFGLQWFYLQRPLYGMICIPFGFIGISVVAGWVHCVLLLRMSEKKFLQTYDPDRFQRIRLDSLEKLHDLKAKGVIGADEFEMSTREWAV